MASCRRDEGPRELPAAAPAPPDLPRHGGPGRGRPGGHALLPLAHRRGALRAGAAGGDDAAGRARAQGPRRQTCRYDDGSGDELDVPLGTTAFVSGEDHVRAVSAEDREFARTHARRVRAPTPTSG